jgi:hypothetical protein
MQVFADNGSFILHPFSRHRRNWELVCTLVVLYQVVSIPYRMAFAPTSTNMYCALLCAVLCCAVLTRALRRFSYALVGCGL